MAPHGRACRPHHGRLLQRRYATLLFTVGEPFNAQRRCAGPLVIKVTIFYEYSLVNYSVMLAAMIDFEHNLIILYSEGLKRVQHHKTRDKRNNLRPSTSPTNDEDISPREGIIRALVHKRRDFTSRLARNSDQYTDNKYFLVKLTMEGKERAFHVKVYQTTDDLSA